jgi:integrase
MPFLTDDMIRALSQPPKGNRIYYDQPDPNIPETKDVVTAGLGLRVTAAGHRAWVFDYRLKDGSGTQRRLTIARFPYLGTAAARKRARKLREEIETGADPQGEKSAKRQEPTIDKLADDWTLACARKVKAEMLRQGTAESYERALRLHIRPQLGDIKIRAITKKTVLRFHEKITLDGKPVQANRSVAVLSSMLAWAVSEELLAVNPVIKAVKFNREEQRDREITPEERGRLVAELARHDTQSARALILLMLTGARSGEVKSMKWDDLVMSGDEPNWNRKGRALKGKRNHSIPLNGPALQLLSTIHEEALARDGAVTSPFVFPSTVTKSGFIRDVRRMWHLILRRAGITDLRPHDLRHFFASVLASSGSSLPLVGSLLGHRSTASTARYARPFADARREASERAAQTIMGGTSGDNVVPMVKRGAN